MNDDRLTDAEIDELVQKQFPGIKLSPDTYSRELARYLADAGSAKTAAAMQGEIDAAKTMLDICGDTGSGLLEVGRTLLAERDEAAEHARHMTSRRDDILDQATVIEQERDAAQADLAKTGADRDVWQQRADALRAKGQALADAAKFVNANSFCEYKSGGCGELEGCPWCSLQAALAEWVTDVPEPPE